MNPTLLMRINWTNIMIGVIISVLFISLVLVFCIVLIRLYFTKIKNYTFLLYQKDIDFQKTLNSTIIETQEQVLNNISQDLHDDAGQQLTYINFQLENLKLDSAQLNGLLEPISESVGQLSASIRSISHSLNNQLLLQQDLIKAIESEIIRLQKNSPILIEFTVADKNEKFFSANEKIVIYRIFQEIINNIFKHSKATEVTVQVKADAHFELMIFDNGKGFDTDSVKNKLTLGLKNMALRAAVIGYTIDIRSAPEKGTTVKLSENFTKHG